MSPENELLLKQYIKIIPAMMNTIKQLEQCCYEDNYSLRVSKATALAEANAEMMLKWAKGDIV